MQGSQRTPTDNLSALCLLSYQLHGPGAFLYDEPCLKPIRESISHSSVRACCRPLLGNTGQIGPGTPSYGRNTPFVRKDDTLRTGRKSAGTEGTTHSYGRKNPFVRGGQSVRTGGVTRSYGGWTPFVRKGDPVRTGGTIPSYGGRIPFLRWGQPPVDYGASTRSERINDP